MFDQYGPNSLKVSAFIKAVGNLPADDFALVGPTVMDEERLDGLMRRIQSLESERVDERASAFRDAAEAVRDKGTELQRKLVASLAAILVLEDRLARDEKTFLSLFLVNT